MQVYLLEHHHWVTFIPPSTPHPQPWTFDPRPTTPSTLEPQPPRPTTPRATAPWISRKPPRPTTLDPRPSTLICYCFFGWTIYKIRETISGQCWLTVCDAGLTLAERILYILGIGTIRNICWQLIWRIIDCHLSPTTVLQLYE